MFAATMLEDEQIFSAAAHTFKNIDAFPLSPILHEIPEYEFEDALPLPITKEDFKVKPLEDFKVKQEVFDTPFFGGSFFGENEDLDCSTASESDGCWDNLNPSVEPKVEQFTPNMPNMVSQFVPHLDNQMPMLRALSEILSGFDRGDKEKKKDCGFSEVQHRYENFQRLVTMLIPILRDPVNEHDLTQAERNHLKTMLKNVQNDVETQLVKGVLDDRICEWKFHFQLSCPLPRNQVYQENINSQTVYFFKDHAKTYIDPQTGSKRPYALQMKVCVVNKLGIPYDQDVDVKISLFRIFAHGRKEEVPEFRTEENGKRKRNWGMIMGNVLAGKSRICVKNKDNDKSKSTAIQTLIKGRGTLFARVEIPAQPGPHHWVLTPANLGDDIGRAIGKDFVVKSKRTARRKRKREDRHEKRDAKTSL